MKTIKLGNSELKASNIALGCMRMSSLSQAAASRVVETAVNNGIDFFDHADIYGQGMCEKIFGEILKGASFKRNDIILQSKCGIRAGYFDFSKEHILNSVEGILQRLGTDYLDVLVLHRPDTLMEPEEVAEAFTLLSKSGKVLNFGVSNQKPMQVELLQKYISQKLIVNQLQFGVMHTGMVDQGIHVNMLDKPAVDRDNSILEYSRLKEMTIQAWSPYQYGFFEGVFLDNPNFPKVNKLLKELAEKYKVSNTAIATAWILRHPARMQVIIGTMSATRISDIVQASEIELTREEWYAVYQAAGNILP